MNKSRLECAKHHYCWNWHSYILLNVPHTVTSGTRLSISCLPFVSCNQATYVSSQKRAAGQMMSMSVCCSIYLVIILLGDLSVCLTGEAIGDLTVSTEVWSLVRARTHTHTHFIPINSKSLEALRARCNRAESISIHTFIFRSASVCVCICVCICVWVTVTIPRPFSFLPPLSCLPSDVTKHEWNCHVFHYKRHFLWCFLDLNRSHDSNYRLKKASLHMKCFCFSCIYIDVFFTETWICSVQQKSQCYLITITAQHQRHWCSSHITDINCRCVRVLIVCLYCLCQA